MAYRHAWLIDLHLQAKFNWNQRNFLWTDGRTYIHTYARTERHLRPALLGWLCPSFMSDLFIPSPITSSSDSPLCSSITPSLSFTPGLKPTCFTHPTPIVSLLPPGLPSRTIAWTVSSKLLNFLFFVFLYFFFISLLCIRLRCPSRQLMCARKYTVSIIVWSKVCK